VIEWNIISFTCLICSAMSGVSAALTLVAQRTGPHLLWGMLSVFISVWTFGLFLCFSAADGSSALFWARTVNYFAIFIPVLLFHFIVLFIDQRPRYFKVLSVYYVISILYVLITVYWPDKFLIDPTFRLQLFWFPIAGPLFYFFPVLCLWVVGHSVQLLMASRVGQSRHKKLKINYLLIVVIVGMAGGGSTFHLEFDINILPFGIACVAVMDAMFTYAILRHDLLDIPETVSLLVARLMLYIGIFAVTVVLLQLDFISQSVPLSQSQLSVIGLWTILACELYRLIKEHIHKLSDRMLNLNTSQRERALRNVILDLDNAANFEAVLPVLRLFFERLGFAHHYSWYLEENLVKPSVAEFSGADKGAKLAKQELDSFKRILFSDEEDKIKDELPAVIKLARADGANASGQIALQQVVGLMSSEQLDSAYQWVEKVPERELIALPLMINDALKGLLLVVVGTPDCRYSDQMLLQSMTAKLSSIVERVEICQNKEAQRQQFLLEKIASLQALAESIAHDMRAPLRQLDYFVSEVQSNLMREDIKQTSFQSQTAQAELLIEHSLQFIDLALGYVKNTLVDAKQFQQLSIQNVVASVLSEYVFLPEERERVRTDLRIDFEFQGDEALFVNVLFLLLRNALSFCGSRPDFEISLTSRAATEEESVLVVRDNGPGISSELKARLFDDFVSGNDINGAWFGLIYCRQIMRSFGGDIRCQSEQGLFTEFLLYFPSIKSHLTSAKGI